MGAYAHITVDGYEFVLDDSNLVNGVCFDALNQTIGERFVTAFRRATDLFFAWRPYATYCMYSGGRALSNMPLDELQTLSASARHIAESGCFDADYTDAAMAVHKQCDVALDRRHKPKSDFFRRAHPISMQKVAGYVYLIQSPTGTYKIGRTKNPADRMKTFSVKLPFEVEYVAVIQTLDMRGLEAALHRRYEDKHVNGEWFALDAADVEAIKALAVQP